MSAGRHSTQLLTSLRQLVGGLIGWIFVAPMAWVMPRRRDWVAVLGRGGKFIGNAKYFFLDACGAPVSGLRVVYFTDRPGVADKLERAGAECLGVRILPRTWFLLRAGTVVLDSTEWSWRFFRYVIVGARTVQLWHGVAYKRIGLDKFDNEVGDKVRHLIPLPLACAAGRIVQTLNGHLIRYDVVNSTSRFYLEEVFQLAMRARHWIIAGYPRNTFGRGQSDNDLVRINVDGTLLEVVQRWRAEGRRQVLLAPTFRDTGEPAVPLDKTSLAKLSAFAEQHAVEFIFKLHVRDRDRLPPNAPHVHTCDPESDIYPLLPLVSALVTDYSSIYMDYLLLDRPVLFFVPDLARYQSDSRQFQFDFDSMTPGPKLTTWDALLDALLAQWAHDDYAVDRARLRRLAFDGLPQEEATPKLLGFMRQQGWVQSSSARQVRG